MKLTKVWARTEFGVYTNLCSPRSSASPNTGPARGSKGEQGDGVAQVVVIHEEHLVMILRRYLDGRIQASYGLISTNGYGLLDSGGWLR